MKKKFLALVCVLCILWCFPCAALASAYGSVNEAMKAVARVYTEGNVEYYIKGKLVGKEENTMTGKGSCFAVGTAQPVSYFVTNRHVVEDSEEVYEDDNGDSITAKYSIRSVYIIMDDIPTKCPADVITLNEGGSDLAILRLRKPTDQREPATLHPYSDPVEEQLVGSDVWAIGYPGISDRIYKETTTDDDLLLSSLQNVRTAKGSFTGGISASISSTGGEYIETNTTINPGNSGGPLVDENGAVLGVCTTKSTSVVGANGAVSVNEVITLLDSYNVPWLALQSNSATGSLFSTVPVAVWIALASAVLIGGTAVILRKKPSRKVKTEEKPSGSRNQEGKPDRIEITPTKPPPEKRILYGVSGPLEGRSYLMTAGSELVIGRNTKRCNVLFADDTPGVSSIHCIIKFDGKKASIRDFGSSYGTYVNGHRLPVGTDTSLHRGGSIDIGSESMRFTLQ